MAVAIDRDRLVDWASKAIAIPSFTGSEEAMAVFMVDTFEELGLQVQWQQVEDGPANVVGTWAGAGGGGGRGGRLVGNVQRAHGPLVLRPGAVARGRPGLSAGAVRPRGAAL